MINPGTAFGKLSVGAARRPAAAAVWFLLLLPLCGAAEARKPVDCVNVFTGTSNSRWMLFPGATLPFGLVKLSPDNQANVWNGGYEYTVGSISGFGHLHAFCLSGVSLMPVTGPIEYNPGLFRVFPGSPDGPFGTMWTSGYRSRIRKEDEQGSPGYYATTLIDWGVRAELTATLRCGMMRLTYPETREAHLLLDFAFPTEELNRIHEAVVRRTGAGEISGFIRQSNNYAGEHTVCFVIQLDRAIGCLDAWQLGRFTGQSTNYGVDWQTPVQFQRDVREFQGHDRCGVVLNFATTEGAVVRVRTGISVVSVEQARLNLETEMRPFGWDFDAVVREARATWDKLLSRVEVAGASEADRAMFYTCLYRAYAAKSVINDVDGAYRDANRSIRSVATAGAPSTAATRCGDASGRFSRSGRWSTRASPAPGSISFSKPRTAAAGSPRLPSTADTPRSWEPSTRTR